MLFLGFCFSYSILILSHEQMESLPNSLSQRVFIVALFFPFSRFVHKIIFQSLGLSNEHNTQQHRVKESLINWISRYPVLVEWFFFRAVAFIKTNTVSLAIIRRHAHARNLANTADLN